MKNVGIIGASGYTGFELIKILAKHKGVSLKVVNSTGNAGKKIKEMYPEYAGSEVYTNYSVPEINKMGLDCIFLAVPPTAAFEYAGKLACTHIIDLSADFRFAHPKSYESTYQAKFPGKKNPAVYGLPELHGEKIKKARIIANPGCYATACLLGSLPIQKIAKYIVFDCISGWSGAGKESAYAKDPSLLQGNVVAYKLTEHRHKPEIEQFLKAKISFTPHVFQAFRGIMCTAHILLGKKMTKEKIIQIFESYYEGKPFVKIVTDGVPDIKSVQNTNFCRIGGFEIDKNNQLVVVSVLDNLVKGASGQAVQNMNLALGFEEKEGLV